MMLTTVDGPRYMAFNKGQEAFQLFYERLLLIKKSQNDSVGFLRENRFHLTTMVNTFNRHYCTGIAAENKSYGIDGRIEPVYVNLGLYDDSELDLHRLIAVELVCIGNKIQDDTFYFIFDNPAYDQGNGRRIPTRIEQRKAVFRVSIELFTKTYYRREIYSFPSKNLDKLNLIFDESTWSFTYTPLSITNIQLIYNGTHPPLYSHLYVKGTTKNGLIRCYDESGAHNLMGRGGTLGTTPYYWLIDPIYIAHNRYTPNQKIALSEITDGIIGQTTAEPKYKRIFAFLFGTSDMIYLFANFNRLVYRPGHYCIESLKNDTESINATRGRSELKQLIVTSGYGSFDRDRLVNTVSENTTINDEKNTKIYVSQYHHMNNLMNCCDIAMYTIKGLANQSLQSTWTTMTPKDKISEFTGWYPDEGVPESVAPRSASSKSIITDHEIEILVLDNIISMLLSIIDEMNKH